MNCKVTMSDGKGNKFIHYYNSRVAAERAADKLKPHGMTVLEIEEIDPGKKKKEAEG